MKPLISIGLSTFNRPRFLREAVLSVLKQSYENFELIISNDYVSAPVTIKSLKIKKDARIKIINQKRNLGEIKNLNYMLSLAKGNWFLWLADDDLLHPEFLSIFHKTFQNIGFNNTVGFFSSFISAKSPTRRFPVHLNSNNSIFYNQENFLLAYTSRKINLIGCYGVMSKKYLLRLGGMIKLGDSFSPYSDTLLPILLTKYGNICWVDQPLVFLRTHNDSLSYKSSDLNAYTSASVDFLKHLKNTLSAVNLSYKKEILTNNMIRWFSINEWEVISRDFSLSNYSKLKKFILHQSKSYFVKLSGLFLFRHIFFIFYLLLKHYLIILIKSILYQSFFNRFRKYHK